MVLKDEEIEKLADDEDKVLFLEAAKISIEGLGKMLHSYGEKALSLAVCKERSAIKPCFKSRLVLGIGAVVFLNL